jgi:serine/threonine-protein kinase
MKSCPQCQRVFPNDAGFCPADGTPLIAPSQAPIAMSDDARIGTKLCGRYEIRRKVADGGMGRVYEGIDRENDSRIALKILHDEVAKDEIALERFKREYEISALLPHDHIVSVSDFKHDTDTGTWVLVMEFLDGEELRYVLKRERVLAPERILRVLSQVAIGLDEAHKRGLIHRDMKPDNIFLCGTRDGDVVKILDFGSAKDTAGNRKKLTVLGTTIGSPYYMAPEQAQGLDTLDGRADVFALAAVAYECLTGEVPFSGNNGPSILLSILTKDPVAVSVKAAGGKYPVPPALDDVIDDALVKNATLRTRTVGALADAFGRAYGLEGDHRTWAATPEDRLGALVVEGRARAQAPKVAPLAIASDPFAPAPAPEGEGVVGGALMSGMDHAFAATREADLVAQGVPAGKPQWLLPVIVGFVALLVGGAVTLVVMMNR